MRNPVITLANHTHHGKPVVSLRFEKDYGLISKVKTLKGAAWSQSQGFWYIPREGFSLNEVFEALKDVAWVDYSAIENDKILSDKGAMEITSNSSSNASTKSDEDKYVDVLCNEKEKTFYLALPFALKEQFKKLEGAWWHPKLKQWSAIDTEENREQLRALLQESGLKLEFKIAEGKKRTQVKTPKLVNPVMPNKKFIRHMQLENKAASTMKQYAWYVKWFLTVNRGAEIDNNPGEMVKRFLHEEVLNRGYGKTSQNLALSALQNYYRIVYNIDLHAEAIPRPKQKRPLPKVLSEEEFIKIYKQCHNQKHQIVLKLMYGCGLRRNEVCTLKTEDVNIDRELIFVKGKGGKYRPINPGKRLIEDMKEYQKNYSPGEYLIEGQGGGTYSGTSIAKIIERLSEKAGLKRKVTPHMLRHTFATHHMEKGTELRLIQEALGHASSKTTEIYTRVSRNSIKKMRNLLDDLEI
ncbi:MAG TPA: tyrosine-type recombinase/integrase [Bacteroidales bacterium]|nr:tyrosine-type recombinase/integrase [Bacteroidales bacterium]